MSARYGSLPGVANHYGSPGLGVLGSVVRSDTATGAHGPGYLYNDWASGDDGKEFRGLIVTPPASGTLFAREDGSFDFTAPADGSYSFTYRLYVDGADLGTAVASFTVGAPAGVTGSAAGSGAFTMAATGAVVGALGSGITGSAAGVGAYSMAGTGAVAGYLGEIGPAPTLQRGKRLVPVGDPTAPKKLQRMDYQEADNITFDHADQLLAGETIQTASVTAALHLGADDSPALLLQYAPQMIGADVIQRVRGRVSGATYMLRCVSTLNTGRQLVGAALLPVYRLR